MGKWAKLAVLALGLVLAAFPQKQKKEENQVLQFPKDLPSAVEGDPRHFSFYVTPLSPKGQLSKQVRDALAALNRESRGDTILKIRAFVAGSGDGRRVRDIVSEVFTDHKQPLPALSLVQAGGLPDGAQVVLEAIAVARREVNPQGLAFLSAQVASADDPAAAVAPLVGKSLNNLGLALKASGSEPSDVVRLSCFLSSLDDLEAVRKQVEEQYPTAAADFVKTQRSPARGLAACEAVAKLRVDAASGLRLMNSAQLPAAPGGSQIALVASSKVVLTGTQLSFGFEEKDARLAFERLGKALSQAGASMHDVAFAHFYPLAPAIAAQVEKVRGDFFDPRRLPASSQLIFEGLSSMNAGFAFDVVAVK